MSSVQVDQLFTHLSQQLVQVCSLTVMMMVCLVSRSPVSAACTGVFVDCDDDGVSSAQVDQLFTHLSQQLVQVRSSVSDALQRRYDYYTSFPSQLSAQVVEDISRQLTALRAVIDYTEKVDTPLYIPGPDRRILCQNPRRIFDDRRMFGFKEFCNWW